MAKDWLEDKIKNVYTRESVGVVLIVEKWEIIWAL